jgi:hypothetical protein
VRRLICYGRCALSTGETRSVQARRPGQELRHFVAICRNEQYLLVLILSVASIHPGQVGPFLEVSKSGQEFQNVETKSSLTLVMTNAFGFDYER